MRPVIFELPEIVLLLSQASALIVKREEAVANIVVYHQFLPEELVVHEPIALYDELQEKVLFADFECP